MLSLFYPLLIFNESIVENKRLSLLSLSNKVKNAKEGLFKYACALRTASNTSPLRLLEDGSDSTAFMKIYT